nr:adenylate kinase [Cryptococcus depauperatus CBS 7841]
MLIRRLSGLPFCTAPLRSIGSNQALRLHSGSNSTTSKSPTSQIAGALGETFSSIADKFRQATEYINSDTYDGVVEKGLRMLVFGKPGSGKGTLSSRLIKDYDISFVSTGDVLRKEIAAKSEVGRKAEAVVAAGGLVSDELMLEIVKSELDRLKGKSWIIDGFPRTLHQGELLDSVLNSENRPLNMIVHLNVPDSVIMARIAARWVHLPSGRVYNTTYLAPKVPGRDDVTGEPLSKRPDDTPETFSKRLRAYYESTAPLLEYFENNYPDSLYSISGSSSDEVHFASGFSQNPSNAQGGSSSDGAHHASASFSTNDSTPSQTHKPSHNLVLEQLWPQLVEIIEPFKLKRRIDEGKGIREEDVKKVREEADDLKDQTVLSVGANKVQV